MGALHQESVAILGEVTQGDTVHLKRILDEVRIEAYKEFSHKVRRG